MKNQLEKIKLDHTFIDSIPKDDKDENFSRQVFGAGYSFVQPEKPSDPKLIIASKEVLNLLDISESEAESNQFLNVFSGNTLLEGMKPFATCYGGHQFGHWAGQLGDGRAINLCEMLNSKNQRWWLQLKGAGPTPYSRSADGYAVLRSSVREFLCSEAMHHLGVPTTRALSLIYTGDNVLRDMFYNGNPKEEQGAVVCRVAPNFTRFGHFELPSSRGDITLLKKLLDLTISSTNEQIKTFDKETYINWFHDVCQKTMLMIVHWMRVGFVHGVMNTDNMSVLGLTIDYGPYGWLENYDPSWTPNTTDGQGKRYCFGNQPMIAAWNLSRLGNAIYPLINDEKPLQEALDHYANNFQSNYENMLANKIGFARCENQAEIDLVQALNNILQCAEIDMTIFFRELANLNLEDESLLNNMSSITELLQQSFYRSEELNEKNINLIKSWLGDYQVCFKNKKITNLCKTTLMNATNPCYVLRNYLAQEAIELSEKGDHSKIFELHETLKKPYEEQTGRERLKQKRPEWARHKAGCSMLSCSS